MAKGKQLSIESEMKEIGSDGALKVQPLSARGQGPSIKVLDSIEAETELLTSTTEKPPEQPQDLVENHSVSQPHHRISNTLFL